MHNTVTYYDRGDSSKISVNKAHEFSCTQMHLINVRSPVKVVS